jgi:hypothetical protein
MADLKTLKAAFQLAKMEHDSHQTEESEAAYETAKATG